MVPSNLIWMEATAVRHIESTSRLQSTVGWLLGALGLAGTSRWVLVSLAVFGNTIGVALDILE